MTAILHTVNKSPFTHATLKQCLDRYTKGDAIILLEDGVYGALTSHAYITELQKITLCYAIEKDIIARGLHKASLASNITLINDEQWVTLATEYPLNQSWY